MGERPMATKRKPAKRQPGKRRTEQDALAAEELALAEEILRRGKEEEADLVAGWDKFLKQLGIRGKPIGAKKLRQRLIKEGLDPNSNEFSQGIVAMREE